MEGKVRCVKIKSGGEVCFIGANNKMYLARKGEFNDGQCLVFEREVNRWKHITTLDFEETKVTAQKIWESL